MVRTIRRGVLLLMVWSLTLAGGPPVLAAGNVLLHGTLVREPCVVAAGSAGIVVDFDAIADKYLYINTRTPPQSFEIHLENCDPALANRLTLTFSGTASQALPGLLAVDGVAKGFAVGLETGDGHPLPPGQATAQQTLTQGNMTLPFRAYIQGEPDALHARSIVRGPFTATATFTLAYP
jgi:type 1 fimbria pilin